MALGLKFISVLGLALVGIGFVQGRDECTDLFFTPAWHACLMKKIQGNWDAAAAAMDQLKFSYQISTIPPVVLPNVDEIIERANIQAALAQEQAQNQMQLAHENAQFAYGHGQTFPGNSFSSSSFSSASGGSSSKSVLSSNGRTWIIESEGLPTSSTTDEKGHHVQVIIGEPSSTVKTYGADNSLKVVANYPSGAMKWLKITLDSPTRVIDLKVEAINGIMHIDGDI